MARANPQWQHFANGQEVLTVFHGPHSYISPSWYETELAVPTWNYVAVHAYGSPQLIEDETELQTLLQETIDTYEASFPISWKGDLPEDFRAKLIKAIVGFEIPISRIEGKFKLGQNRSPEDLQGVFQALSNSTSENDQELAKIMTHESN
jgi:transcriptional regulator